MVERAAAIAKLGITATPTARQLAVEHKLVLEELVPTEKLVMWVSDPTVVRSCQSFKSAEPTVTSKARRN